MARQMNVNWGRCFIVVAIVQGVLQPVSSVVEIFEENNGILECPLTGDYDYPEWRFVKTGTVVAYSNGTILDGYQWQGSKNLTVVSARYEQSGDYVCKVESREATVKLYVNEVQFSILEAVLGEDDLGNTVKQINTKFNQNFTVTCVLTKIYSTPSYLDISIFSQYLGPDVETQFVRNDDESMTVTTTQNVTANENFDYQDVICTAGFTFGSISDRALLRLFFPPHLQSYSVTNPGTDMQRFECTGRSRPKTSVNWYVDGQPLNTVTDIGKNETSACTVTQAKLWDCEGILVLRNLKKEDNKRTVMCDLVYQEESFGNKTYTLSVRFPPTQVNVTVPLRWNLTSDVTEMNVTGTTDSALGLGINSAGVNFVWYIKLPGDYDFKRLFYNYNIKTDLPGLFGGFRRVETISMNVTRRQDGAVVMCKASNSENFFNEIQGESDPLELYYTPIILHPKKQIAYFAYSGSTFQLPCIVDSKSGPTISWQKHEGGIWSPVTLTRDNQPDRLTLKLENLEAADAGYYRCIASNEIGQQEIEIHLAVDYEPAQRINFWITEKYPNAIEVYLNTEKPPLDADDVTSLTHYVQYRHMTSNNGEKEVWRELEKPMPSTFYDEEVVTYTLDINDLRPGRPVEVRIKSVDEFGRVIYSEALFLTPEEEEKKTHTEAEMRNAILISVFATAAVFIIIIIIIVCVMKKGACGASSSKRYST